MEEIIIKKREIIKEEKEKSTKEKEEKGQQFSTPLPKRKMTGFTGDEIKEKIVNFLKESKGSKFPVRDLSRRLSIASYPTILKWTEVLIGCERIQSEHYGNIKLVFIENEKNN